MPTKGEDLEVSNKIHLPDKKKKCTFIFRIWGRLLLVQGFLSLGRRECFQLQTGLVDIEDSEAEEGVPHLKYKEKST